MSNFDEKYIVVTIDGVAASGKSTTAKLVAESLGFNYIDSYNDIFFIKITHNSFLRYK